MKAGSGTLTPQMAAECKEITGYKDGWENLETGVLLAQKHQPLARIKGVLKRVNSKYGWNDASATEAIVAKLRLHGHTADADRIVAEVAPVLAQEAVDSMPSLPLLTPSLRHDQAGWCT